MKTKKKVYKEFGEGLRYLVHDGEKPVFRYVGSLGKKRTRKKRTFKKRATRRSVRKRS